MVRFGPAGNSARFYDEGYTRTEQAFEWIARMGLDAYEYSFGRGVRLKHDTAKSIGQAAAKEGVALSVHAPYYINLATPEPEKEAGSLRYIRESAEAALWMGADRVVIHPGSLGRMTREEAFGRVLRMMPRVIDMLKEQGLWDVTICPETMGKVRQIGDLGEVVALCRLDERILPAIDFAHLHARGKGAINTQEDYAAILDTIENGLGADRANRIHVHFAKIEYTAAGERRHRIFADEGFGPPFRPLARLFAQRAMAPRVICESRGTMADDAAEMKKIYLEEKERL